MFLNYCKTIYEMWGEKAPALLMLKSGILAYPICKAHGISLSAPLAIEVEDEKIAEYFFREISGYGACKVIPLSLPKKEFANRMSDVEYELMPILCNAPSKHDCENLLTLVNAMTSGEVDGYQFDVLPVIAFKDGIPVEYTEFLSGKIVIEGKCESNLCANSDKIIRESLEVLLENMSLIKQKLQSLNGDGEVSFLRFLAAVSQILFENLPEINTEIQAALMKDMRTELQYLEDHWNIENDFSPWIEILHKILLENRIGICGTSHCNNVSAKEKWLERCVIYDEKYYYLSTRIYEEACDKIPYIGQMELKKALCDAGILIGEGANRRYYTVKVPVRTKQGVQVIGRRVRLLRRWLDIPGELSWQEKIEEQMKNQLIVITPPNKKTAKKEIGMHERRKGTR